MMMKGVYKTVMGQCDYLWKAILSLKKKKKKRRKEMKKEKRVITMGHVAAYSYLNDQFGLYLVLFVE